MTFELLLFSICVGVLNGLAISSLTLTLIDNKLQKQKQIQKQQKEQQKTKGEIKPNG